METTSISCLMPRFRSDATQPVVGGQLMPSVSTPRCRGQVATWRLQPQSQDSSSARASLSLPTRNTHTGNMRTHMHARHCTSDMKQIRFTPTEGRTPECNRGGGGGFLCQHTRSRLHRRVRARVIPECHTQRTLPSQLHPAELNYNIEDGGKRLRCS